MYCTNACIHSIFMLIKNNSEEVFFRLNLFVFRFLVFISRTVLLCKQAKTKPRCAQDVSDPSECERCHVIVHKYYAQRREKATT